MKHDIIFILCLFVVCVYLAIILNSDNKDITYNSYTTSTNNSSTSSTNNTALNTVTSTNQAINEDEILFRKIPWGITYKRVMKKLRNLDYEWSELHEFNYRSLKNIYIGKENEDSNFVSAYYVDGTPKSEPIKVGGL